MEHTLTIILVQGGPVNPFIPFARPLPCTVCIIYLMFFYPLQARAGISEWPWDNDLETDSLGGDEGAGSDGEGGGCTTRAKLPKAKKFRFSRLTLSGQYIGLCRRRVGRGGRYV